MPWLSYLLYHLLKGLLLLALPFHYPGIQIRNRKHLRVGGPTLVVSNHPNTLMDPLNVVIRINRPVFFLANASLFKNPRAGRILRFLFTLPVERAQDVQGRPVRNERHFQAVIGHLRREGNIWIAPEGGSLREWRLRPVKTGLARIALQALDQLPQSEKLRILPVGLTYAEAGCPGGSLVMQAGPPIRVEAYADLYREHARLGIRKLTEAVEAQLKSLLVHCPDPEMERRLRWADRLAQSRQPLPFGYRYDRLRLGAYRLSRWPKDRRTDWERRYDELKATLVREGIMPEYATPASSWPPLFLDVMLMILGLPLAIWGGVHNLLPLGLPWAIQRLAGADPEYSDTILVLAGMVTLPLFYGLQTAGVARFLGWEWAMLYLVSLPLLAHLAWSFGRFVLKQFPGRWRAARRLAGYRSSAQPWMPSREELLCVFDHTKG